MDKAAGYFLVIFGFALAIYLAFWLMLVGGVVDVIALAKAEVLDKSDMAIPLLKVLLSTYVYQLIVRIFTIPGFLLIKGY